MKINDKYYAEACGNAKDMFFLCGINKTQFQVERDAQSLREEAEKNHKVKE